jgi:putative transposase
MDERAQARFHVAGGIWRFQRERIQSRPRVKYIHNQDGYHKKIAFEQEFLALLRKHGVDFDPKYVLG